MKRAALFLICLISVFAVAVSCGGGGGGGGAVAFQTSPSAHNGGDAGGWGKGNQTGNGYGGNGGGIGSGGDSNLIITGGTPLEVGRYVYNGTSYDNAEALCNALKELSLPDTFNIDFYVEGESTPRTARVTANGKANNGQDIFIEHQYKAVFPADNGGIEEVLFYKRDGITLPGEGGTVNIDGFDYENGWKIDGTFYSPGAKLSVASSGDVDLMSRAVQETSVFGFKSDGVGGYIMGFRNDALQANGNNNIVVSSDKQISSIELPSSPVDLDLSQATGFTNVNFGSSNKERLAGITLPNTVTTIADTAFQNCTGLSSVNLPPSVTIIGDNAFDTSALTAIEIPASVQSIGLGAFNSCYDLGTVTFAAGSQLQEIGGNAFFYCSSLSTIELPSTVDTIGQYAFAGCTSLESFTIPNGVTELEGTFFGCSNLASISIPPSVNSLREMTFKDVKPGCQLIFDSTAGTMSVTSGGSGAMPQSPYKVKFTGTSIPTTPGTPGSTIFNSSLLEVTLANTVTAIPQNAFQGCSDLTKVTVENTPAPSSLAAIGASAFYGCTSLLTINIPASVGAIGNQAFGQAGGGNLTMTFDGNQNMAGIVDLRTNGPAYKVVLKNGIPKAGGSSIFATNNPELTEVVYAGGYTLIVDAFTGCSNLNKVTFQSYPTIIEHVNNTDYVFPDTVTGGITIIFAPINGDMDIHDVSDLFNMSSGNFYVFPLSFKFNNSADVGSVPPLINIESGAFYGLDPGLGTFNYIFASAPDYRINYQDTTCFRVGASGKDATDNTINYTWTISGSSGYWQQ